MISKYEPIEGGGKHYLAEGGGKHYLAKVEESGSQNVTEDLKDAIASYTIGKSRKGRRGDPYKGKATKKGKRRRKGKDYQYQEAETWLNDCSLKEQGGRKEFNVPGCGGSANLICYGGCLSIHEVLLVVILPALVLPVLVRVLLLLLGLLSI